MKFRPTWRIDRLGVYLLVLIATALLVYRSAASLEARSGPGPHGIRSWEIFNRGKFELASSLPTVNVKNKKPVVIDIRRRNSCAVIAGDESLDPAPGHAFLVSFAFRFDKLPEPGERTPLVSKMGTEHPFPGWGVGIRVFRDSIRPDVYLKDAYGKGGWHLFDNVKIEAGKWYGLSAIIKTSEYVALYIEPLKFATAPELQFTSAGNTDVTFVGGYDLSSLGVIRSRSNLLLGWKGSKKKSFKGQIGGVLVGFVDEFPQEREKIKNNLLAGPDSIQAKLPASEIKFYLAGGKGRDLSRFSRQVKLQGQARWGSRQIKQVIVKVGQLEES